MLEINIICMFQSSLPDLLIRFVLNRGLKVNEFILEHYGILFLKYSKKKKETYLLRKLNRFTRLTLNLS